MRIIFATTSERKVQDLVAIVKRNDLDIKIRTLNDIGWDLGEIEENGETLQENSLIKARAVHDFCNSKNINDIIIADDAGLFVNSLNGEPGIYTARYAEQEIKSDPMLPKHESVNKLLRKLKSVTDRRAEFKCVVTCMYPNGDFFQVNSSTEGTIAEKLYEPITKPYFYTVFIAQGHDKTFNHMFEEELYNTYRFKALEQTLQQIKDKVLIK